MFVESVRLLSSLDNSACSELREHLVLVVCLVTRFCLVSCAIVDRRC